jgi:hypothetical protein
MKNHVILTSRVRPESGPPVVIDLELSKLIFYCR